MDKRSVTLVYVSLIVGATLLFVAGVFTGRWLAERQQTMTTSSAQPMEEVPEQHADKARGVDVSHYQGTVNWSSVQRTGIAFAYAKATGGTSFVDPQFANNWNGLRKEGLIRGAYHFFHLNEDPIAQGRFYAQTVGAFDAQDLPPILDVEVRDDVPRDSMVTRVQQWLTTVEQATGRRPMLYAPTDFYREYFAGAFDAYPLIQAQYGVDAPDTVGKRWTIWQHSQTGHVPGITGDVDLDLFNGDVSELQAFIKSTHVRSVVQPVAESETPPPASSTVSGVTTHTVQPGETLYSLSRRYGVSVEALQAANNLTGTLIRVGQQLQVPSSGRE